ncbi:hypothetical protein B0H16DRAFT_1585723 [Mycena metata]|uniref:Secreted protein n=1 Tax=Mycena metata TaxID=1033252 RepID=A0AAD7MRR1_9AGAR|nr:hypothetical protein B0H16DRAFT_1585723 [Mycena metata]
MPPRSLRMILMMLCLLRARTLRLLVNPDRATNHLPRMNGLTLNSEREGVMDHFATNNLWCQLTTLNLWRRQRAKASLFLTH